MGAKTIGIRLDVDLKAKALHAMPGPGAYTLPTTVSNLPPHSRFDPRSKKQFD
jgi:hypothetical protein